MLILDSTPQCPGSCSWLLDFPGQAAGNKEEDIGNQVQNWSLCPLLLYLSEDWNYQNNYKTRAKDYQEWSNNRITFSEVQSKGNTRADMVNKAKVEVIVPYPCILL